MAVIAMPTSGATVIYADACNGRVTHVDRVDARILAEYSRRDLRVMQALLSESLDNVRAALTRTIGEPVA